MQIVGMLRVKNEARWIERCIASIRPVCDEIIVMDDHSTDGTPQICAGFPGITVFESPFSGLDETRDKTWLLTHARFADWVVCIDGDEMLAPGGANLLLATMRATDAHSISMRIPYLWDREDQIRIDGVYGEFRRHSAFRPKGYSYTSCTAGGFHCGNVPMQARGSAVTIGAQLLHFGYMLPSDRERKYCWYNARDPHNMVEDQYRHIAAGLDTPHAVLIDRQKQFRREAGLPELLRFELLPPAPAANQQTAHAGPMAFQEIITCSQAA